MKKQPLIIAASLLLAGMWSCKKEEANGLTENNSTPPGVVSSIAVQNENGAATISYALPKNPDLLYVKAVYALANGTKREVKASYYTNQLEVDGFTDTLKHTVQLFAVNRSEVASDPVEVQVQPLVSPMQLVFRNLTVKATAGGIRIKSINQFKGNVVIVPMIDSLNNGQWAGLDNIYTSDSLIAVSIRGLAPVQRKFAFFVRDRWLNHTDTLYATLTPSKEILLDKNNFFVYQCDNETKMSFGTTIDLMWKGLVNNEWPCT